MTFPSHIECKALKGNSKVPPPQTVILSIHSLEASGVAFSNGKTNKHGNKMYCFRSLCLQLMVFSITPHRQVTTIHSLSQELLHPKLNLSSPNDNPPHPPTHAFLPSPKCYSLSVKCSLSPQMHVFEHLVLSCRCCFSRLWNLPRGWGGE